MANVCIARNRDIFECSAFGPQRDAETYGVIIMQVYRFCVPRRFRNLLPKADAMKTASLLSRNLALQQCDMLIYVLLEV